MDSELRKASRLFASGLKHRPVRCLKCGSLDVKLAVWMNPNAPEPPQEDADDVLTDCYDDSSFVYCLNCGSNSLICEHCEPYNIV